jgi:hypothetical protein
MLQWLWFEATTEVWEPSMAARGFAPSLRWACTGRDADGRSKGAGFYAGDMLRGSTLDTATGEWLDALANVYGSWRRLPPSVVFDEAAGLAPVLERTVRQPRTALHLFGPWAPERPRLTAENVRLAWLSVAVPGLPGVAPVRYVVDKDAPR